MSPDPQPGQALIHRHIHGEHEAVLARGDFGPLIEAWEQHVHRWETGIDGLTATMMRQGLAALALHLSCRPTDETSGFTLNVAEPPVNIFLTGDAEQNTVTGRAFTENVATAERSRLFVQTHRRRGPISESTIEFTGLDVLLAFEQYYETSVQTPARFFELSDTDYVMVLGLPGVDAKWVRALDRDRVRDLETADGFRPLDERVFTFQCGCNRDRMLGAVKGMFADDPASLFQGEEGVEVLCPRCGTRWWLERPDFEEAEGEAPPSFGEGEPTD